MIVLNSLDKIRDSLIDATVIAVVGLSPKQDRPSNMVARYLLEVGYTIIPVNPGHDSILGLQCYPSIKAINRKIDIVDIFRRSEEVLPVVQQAVETDCKVIWMQQGIINSSAAKLATRQDKMVVMDRCIKIDHANLLAAQ